MSASNAVSTQEKREDVMEHVNYYNLYSNWFAVEVFNHLTVDQDARNLAYTVKKIMSHNNHSSYGRFDDREKLYTATLSEAYEALSKFLHNENHCCFHQVPLHSGSRPDLYMWLHYEMMV